jgi:unsaturated rhamnogalacturonyl hydrolase
MDRRDFLFKSTTALSLMPVSMAIGHEVNESAIDPNSVIEKVKKAVLTMQRASWEQGVAMQAFLELGDYDMVHLMAQDAVLHQNEEGRLATGYVDNGSTDPACCGEGVLFSARKFNDEKLKAGADKMLEYLLKKAPRSEAGIIYHQTTGTNFWVDSFYMSPPFLAYAGHQAEAVKQIRGYREALWNKEIKLYSHEWNDKKKEFRRKDFWGVGNGWAAAGMSRVIRSMPDSMQTEKIEIIGYVKELIDGCLAFMRPDGLFHNNIDENDTFVETNLSQMLAYSIYRGVKGKWLDKSYLSQAGKMRKAAYEKVDNLGFVQGVCGAPHFNSSGRAAEGQAFFLLMEAAYNDSLS